MIHFSGVGLDSGHMFTTLLRLNYQSLENILERQLREPKLSGDIKCEWSQIQEIIQKGVCTFYHACKVGHSVFYKSDCKYKSNHEEGECTVVSKGYITLTGVCMPEGHCRDIRHPCQDKECNDGHNKYKHEACPKKEYNTKLPAKHLKTQDSKVEETDSESDLKEEFPNKLTHCRGLYNPVVFTSLTRMCRDCYNMYREVEVYNLCTSNCFSSKTFLSCTRSLLIQEDKARSMVDRIGK